MKIRFLLVPVGSYQLYPHSARAHQGDIIGESPSAAGWRRAAVGEDLGEENASRPFLTDERASISSAAIPPRAHVRADRISLEEHFTPEEIDALQLAFSRVDIDGSGVLSIDQLPAAFGQVGMGPTADEINAVLAQLGKPTDGSVDFEFADFARAADMLSPVE